MFRISLLTLTSMLLLTGCFSDPKPPEFSKTVPYKALKSSCETNPPASLQKECTQFLTDLERETNLLVAMAEIHEDAHQEQEYITLADKEALINLKVHANQKLLATECQDQMPQIINSNDLNSVSFCLQFEENTITLDQYNYLKNYAPRFDTNVQYMAFQKQYASKKIVDGLKAMNLGNKKGALEAFKSASEAKNAEATYLVGVIYEEKQIKKAIAWHKKAVAQGVSLSNVNLARLYLRIKLPQQAKTYYLTAAKKNNALAQYRLFKLDSKSKSKKSREAAEKWLKKSAKNNYPQAQYIYGLQLMKKKQRDQAKEWLQKAYANGITESGFFLGKLYFIEDDHAKAYPLLSQATAKGEANFMLAQMFEKGLGVKKNSVLAYRYYKKAHELGQDNHVADMKRLQKRLTKKERQAAKYVGRKAAKKRKATVKRCGPLPSKKNVTVAKKSLHIIGVGIKPVENANGIIVYGEHEKLYYIISPQLAQETKPYSYVNIKAKATGKAIVISNDNGTLQSIYQFKHLATCK